MKLAIAIGCLTMACSGLRAGTPVLLELFTSEGCSSCPSADALLQKLDREQPVSGADLIVMSEHVDYWNQLGWADPFSSALFSERQRQYATHLGGDVYTPELVVDGAKGFVGSDGRAAQEAIRDAIRHEKTAIAVTVQADAGDGKARVQIHLSGPVDGVLYLALAHDERRSQVLRGENAGRGLAHVAVVYSMQKLGKADGDREVTVALKLDGGKNGGGEKTRVIAFVEKQGMGRVVALGQARL